MMKTILSAKKINSNRIHKKVEKFYLTGNKYIEIATLKEINKTERDEYTGSVPKNFINKTSTYYEKIADAYTSYKLGNTNNELGKAIEKVFKRRLRK